MRKIDFVFGCLAVVSIFAALICYKKQIGKNEKIRYVDTSTIKDREGDK